MEPVGLRPGQEHPTPTGRLARRPGRRSRQGAIHAEEQHRGCRPYRHPLLRPARLRPDAIDRQRQRLRVAVYSLSRAQHIRRAVRLRRRICAARPERVEEAARKMKPHAAHAAIVGAVLLALAAPCLIHPQSTNEGSRGEIPVLQTTCLISADVRRLVEFYEPIQNRKANWSGEDYAEFPTRAGVLAIFSAAAQEKYIPGSAEPATNRSVILQFKVADVDAEYRRLQPLVKSWV